MKKLLLLILIFCLSKNVFARTFYLNVMTMASSIYDTGAVEASLFFWNPSKTNQTIRLSNMRLSAFSVAADGNVNAASENRVTLAPLINSTCPGFDPFNVIAVRLDGTPAPGNFVDISSSFSLNANTHYQFVFTLRPNNSFLGNSSATTAGNIVNPFSANRNGPFIGYITLTGTIIVNDAMNSKSGFVFGTGSILRPVIDKGSMSAQSYEFSINNRNPM